MKKSTLKRVRLKRLPVHIGPRSTRGGCSVRALAIATCKSYATCYKQISKFCKEDRKTRGTPLTLCDSDSFFTDNLGYEYFRVYRIRNTYNFNFSTIKPGIYLMKTKTDVPYRFKNTEPRYYFHLSAIKISRTRGITQVVIFDEVKMENFYVKGFYRVFDSPILFS